MRSSPKDLRKFLHAKGWSEDEIEKTILILEEAPYHKHAWIMRFDKLVYWVSLLLGLLGNFVMAVILIPFFLVASTFWLFVMVFLFAFCFGLLFTAILEHIEILQPRHHALNWVVLPVFSFVTVFLIAYLTYYIDTLLNLDFALQNYWIVALTYTIAFMLPYVFFLHRERIILRTEELL